MATKEDTEAKLSALLRDLDGKDAEYSFCIPGWLPESSSMGLRWMRSQLSEGFNVAYQVDHPAKRVQFKCWEYGEPEPTWESAA